jgi:hypothetical protein
MQSKNKAKQTVAEAAYAAMVSEQPCIICDAPPPSEVHEIEQGAWFTSLPLCNDCHQGKHNGIHGNKAIWAVYKMTELKALNKFIGRVVGKVAA